jgi:hypothetical protein
MKYSSRAAFVLLGFLAFLAGCDQPKGEECFRSATGFDLPEGVAAVHAKTITVVGVGDTHYVKFSATKDITAFLAKNFTPTTWSVIEDKMTPPEDWDKNLPFWDIEVIRKGVCYEGRQKEGDFVSALSYEPASGVFYFYGAQCR